MKINSSILMKIILICGAVTLILSCARETKLLVSWPRCGDNPYLCSQYDTKKPDENHFEDFLRLRIKAGLRWQGMQLEEKQGQCWEHPIGGNKDVKVIFKSTRVKGRKGKIYRVRLEGAEGTLVKAGAHLEWHVKVGVKRRHTTFGPFSWLSGLDIRLDEMADRKLWEYKGLSIPRDQMICSADELQG